jgi:hypothetical protein
MGWTRRLTIVLGAAAVLAATSCSQPVDLKAQLKVIDVKTGWFDAGIVEGGMNKLVPTISFQLQNVGPRNISSVQVNAVFRQEGEEQEWSSAYARGIGPEGLEPGATTAAIVLTSTLGYTGEQPRVEMLAHSQFVDARVEVFAKHGSQQWAKLVEQKIDRDLLTR